MCSHGFTVDSNGFAKEYQFALLGKYNYYKPLNGKPSFKLVGYPYYLYWVKSNKWKVLD